MPYPRTLQQYTLPEFYAEPPAEWERRLREVSDKRADLDHLVFRCWMPTEPDGEDRGWKFNDKPIWALYAARPIRLCDPELHELYRKHWSECALEAEQVSLRAVVSDYQHFMWHARGLYVKPFLILQGTWGGTPAKYTKVEEAFLKASGCLSDPLPIGMFPACPFDERVVQQIAHRDRLLACANSYEALMAKDSSAGIAAEQALAEKVKRETYLDTWKVMIQPAADFYEHFIKRSENREQLPRAPEGTASRVGQWREHFLEHGSVIGASVANQRVRRDLLLN